MKINKDQDYYELQNNSQEKDSQTQKLEKSYFFMQGISALLPWSSVLCTLDFYSAKFPHSDVNFTFPVAFFISSVGFNYLMVYIKRHLSLNIRVVGSLFLMLIFLILIPITAEKYSGTNTGLWVCYLLLFLVGAVNTISNATIAGLSGHFSAKCRSLHSAGTGYAALITNFIRSCILAFSSEENPSTDISAIILFYGAAAFLLIFGIVLHFIFIKSEESRAKFEDQTNNDHEQNLKQQWIVFKKNSFLVLAMFICNVQTFMLYPGVLFQKPLDFTNFSWTIVIICSIFNIFDTFGKYLPFIRSLLQTKVLLNTLIFRLFFFVAFIWPVVDKNVVLLSQSWFFLIMIALFGLSNGFVISSSFVMVPEKVEGEKKEVAGFVAFNAMITGIMIGTFLALPFASL